MQNAKTIFVYHSEHDPNLARVVFDQPTSIAADSAVELFLDPFSRRIRIDDYFGSVQQVLNLITLHLPDWAEKIIVKSRPKDRHEFIKAGYMEEAMVFGYFSGIDMHFLTAYPNLLRGISEEHLSNDFFNIESFSGQYFNLAQNNFLIHTAVPEDAEELSDFYEKIFPLYPTPINDSGYLRKIILGDSVYQFIRSNGKIVSAACAEINWKYHHAELSDCGTLPEAAGKGCMKTILSSLIQSLTKTGILSTYSIARAKSESMNMVFKNLGFVCTGVLIQNVNIFSGFENMLVWSNRIEGDIST